MTALRLRPCEPCRADAPGLGGPEADGLMRELPRWERRVEDGVEKLVRRLQFRDFKTALAFTMALGRLAEAEDHHPAITTEWGRATVRWWTHRIGGLHLNDFIMAARTDALAAESGAAESGERS